MRIIQHERNYYLVTKKNMMMKDLLEKVYNRNPMSIDTFAYKWINKIFCDLMNGATDIRRKYEKYYRLEYSDFDEYLYLKEKLSKGFISSLNLKADESLRFLNYKLNSYNSIVIIGYEGENLSILNEFLEEVENEN